MTVSVVKRGARGGGVTVLSQLVRMVIQVLGVVVLSRLLSPEDFGLIAMVGVFMALGELLRDFGIPTAALQARELTRQQASNLFWVNTALGVAAAVALVLCTPLIVGLYGEQALAAIVPAMAFGLLINGLQAQIQVQLARDLKFTALAVTSVLSPLAGLVLAVVAAMAGWGYWALVVQALSTSAVLLASRAVIARWLPLLPRRRHGSAIHLISGGQLGLAQLLTFVANNIDTVVIGARWGAVDLGYYNRAFQLVVKPVAGLLGPLTQVVIPTLNGAASSGRSSLSLLLRMQFALGSSLVLVLMVCATTADSLIPIALGGQWSQAIVLFQILALGECFHVFSYISYWAFLSEQKSKQLLYYNLVTKTIAVALVVGASLISIEAVAWAYAIGLVVSWPINLAWLSRTAGVDGWAFFRGGGRVLVAAATGYVLGRAVVNLTALPASWAALILGGIVSAIVYVLVLFAIPGGRALLADSVVLARMLFRRQ